MQGGRKLCPLCNAKLPFLSVIRLSLTCVSVRCREDENSARSAMLRYCFSRNFFSRDNSCWVVKGVRGFRFGLCFLRLHLTGGGGGWWGCPGVRACSRTESPLIKFSINRTYRHYSICSYAGFLHSLLFYSLQESAVDFLIFWSWIR